MDYRKNLIDSLNEVKLKFDVVETPVYKFVVQCCNEHLDAIEIYPDIFNLKYGFSAVPCYLVCYVEHEWNEKHARFLEINDILRNLILNGAPRTDATHINNLNLSKRTYNALTKEEIYYIEDIIPLMESGGIFYVQNFGKKSAAELCDALKKFGFEVENPFDKDKKRNSETEEIIDKLAAKMNVSSDEVSSMLDELNIQGFRRKKVKEG